MKRLFAIVTALLLCISLMAACDDKGPVNAQEAQTIALESVGVTAAQATNLHTHVIEENGIPCFQIHFSVGDAEYTVLVNASTGEVIK